MRLLYQLFVFIPCIACLLIFSFSYLLVNPPPPITVSLSRETNAVEERTVYVQEISAESLPITTEDIRLVALRRFLTEIHSPLADQAEEIIKQADLHGFDYALLPAIAMQESGGCKTIPIGSHNCWGYGIYGAKVTRFDSYPKAIAKVAKTIKESYIKKGYTNPTLVEDRWTPSSKGEWSYSVNFFMNKIHSYER